MCIRDRREGGEAWLKALARLAVWLAREDVKRELGGEHEEFVARPEGGVVKILVNGKEVAKVEAEVNEGGVVFHVYGSLIDERGQRSAGLAVELVKEAAGGEVAEERRPEPYQLRALLATDGSYDADEGVVYADTTSVVQAAMYGLMGMNVSYAGYGNLTQDGPKPVLVAWLNKEEGAPRLSR